MAKILTWNVFQAGPRDQGFNKPGMEIFDKKEVSSLVREVIQNTTDNPAEGEDQVLVEFKVCKKSFPKPTVFKEILKKCQTFCENYGQTANDPAIKFYEEAQTLLIKPDEIDFLVISDYNTTGIIGKDRERTKGWYRMVESLGVTLGGTSTNSGSKGIGKNAPFILSKLCSVFYSTVSKEDGFAFKGISQLNCYEMEDGSTTNGDYTFCYEGNDAVRELDSIPSQFRRSKPGTGTDIFVAGFALAGTNWEKPFIIETIRNYYAAIWSEKLIVTIGDIVIKKETLLKYANDYLSPKDNTRYFLECLEVDPIKTNLERLGDCSLYIKLNDRFKKRVDYMRNKKMKIFDALRPYIIENFAAVFICEANEGSTILRTMEGAEHIFWDAKKVNGGQKILDDIDNWIRKELLKLSKTTNDDDSIVASTEDLLPMADTGAGSNMSKIPDGKISKEETAQEKLAIPEVQTTSILTLTGPDTRIIDSKGLRVIKIKKKSTGKKEPKTKGKNAIPRTKQTPRKLSLSNDFGIRLVKVDLSRNTYKLFVNSQIDNAITMNIQMIPVGENGEQENIGFIDSAEYEDGKAITVINASGQLCKVNIKPGQNSYTIKTTNNRKLSFNIIGHEI